MSDVVIAGIGQVAVGEHWDVSLRSLAARALLAAIQDAGGLRPQAMYIGNFLGSVVSHQANLGALISENVALDGIEAFTVEAAGASGGAALRLGYLAVASGLISSALVLGVEKYTDQVGPATEAAIAQGMDYDYEGVPGLTATAQAALLTQRYLHTYSLAPDALAGFPLLAHANAAANPNAMFRKAISRETYARAEQVSDPLNLFDVAPYADGAAAVLLTRSALVPESVQHPLVRITGSALAIDTLALHDRPDPLAFEAARISAQRACRQAGILPGEVDFFELSDVYPVYAALSLEAAGFAPRGEGWKFADESLRARDAGLPFKGMPILTMGGMKARGNPLGASGVYQAVEAALQLRGQAGAAQINTAQRAMIQSLGGPASTAVTHILER